jgi:hypothetical protein
MCVSVRYIAAAIVSLTISASSAYAGGCHGCGGGGTNIPVVKGPSGGCCGPAKGHIIGFPGVHVPGPNISVNVGGSYHGGNNVSIGGNTYVGGSTTTVIGGSSSSASAIYVGGGGGGFRTPVPVSAGIIEGLTVSGAQAAAMETYEETSAISETVAIRAVCMDDRGTPHPASRTNGDTRIAPDYMGEIFRCMAGTRMEVTLGKATNGEANFDGGRTMSCQKGQALAYGAKGSAEADQFACVTQKVEADCNERSLLRRFGPGTKFATITRTQTVTKTRQSRSMEAQTLRSSMFVDGGVGQGVF